MSPMKTLIYCLNILRTEKDSEIYRNVLEHVQKVPLEFVNNSNNGSNEWISAMRIIAYSYSSLKNNNNDNDTSSNIFSQSQLSDFLTLSAKGIEEKTMSSEIINSIIFKIY